MKSAILVLPPPVSANRYWATRVVAAKGKRPMAVTYVTAEAKEFKTQAAVAVHKAGMRAPIEGRVRVDILLYPHRPKDWEKRQRLLGAEWDTSVRAIDLDNATKVTLDALKGLAFNDDVLVFELYSKRMEPDHLGARMLVRVRALETEQPQLALEGEGA